MTDSLKWWQRGVVYQIYPRSFMDSNNDGIGDLQGIISKLDYLEWLGVDIIWISPVFTSPMADYGYDVANYREIDPMFGTLADMDELLEQAHSRNIKVLLDFVPNHTSNEHRWFLESRASKDNPKRDWYIWKDPKPDGSPPNNWLAYFGGDAWTFDEVTGQYYLHNFTPEQPDLNWRNPDVQQAMFDNIRFWLERGLDGFRVDVIDRILKDTQFRDNPLDPNWREGDSPVWRVQRVYSEQIFPEIHEYMRKFRAVFNKFGERIIVGEVAYDLPTETMVAYYGQPDSTGTTGDEIHLPFNFTLTDIDWRVDAIKAHVDAYDGAMPTHGWANYVISNHDKPRLASKVGVDQARVAGMLLLTLRGTPTLYYGDELGMENGYIPPERILDPQGKNGIGFNRDECRTPMQWDDSTNAGFNTSAETWLPVSDNYSTLNLKALQTDSTSIVNFYRTLLHLRRDTPALYGGDYIPVVHDTPDVFAYIRQHEDTRLLILLNFTSDDKSVSLPDLGAGKVLLSTLMDGEGDVDLVTFGLRPNEGVVIELG